MYCRGLGSWDRSIARTKSHWFRQVLLGPYISVGCQHRKAKSVLIVPVYRGRLGYYLPPISGMGMLILGR